jgi:uncharacterized protein
MKAKRATGPKGEGIYVLVLDAGEEAFAAIAKFAVDHGIETASLTAIGAFASATVGWFDLQKKTYKKIEVAEQCEVLSLIGDIATGDDGKPSLHAHCLLGLSDGAVRGGHFMLGSVRPTLEIVITEMPAHLRRRRRPELGIALLDLA